MTAPRFRWLSAVSVGALCAVGCAQAPPPSAREAAPTAAAEERVTGQIYVSGTEPVYRVAIETDNGRSLTLGGDLCVELRRLGGAEVEVSGARTGDPAGAFHVLGYEILAVDGQRPWVGFLDERGKTFRLTAHGGFVVLDAVPRGLRRPGAKVWVTGRRTGDTVHVQSFGIIKEP